MSNLRDTTSSINADYAAQESGERIAKLEADLAAAQGQVAELRRQRDFEWKSRKEWRDKAISAERQVSAMFEAGHAVLNSSNFETLLAAKEELRAFLCSTTASANAHDRKVRRQAFDNLPAAIDEWARDRWSKGQLLPKWDDWKVWLRARAEEGEGGAANSA